MRGLPPDEKIIGCGSLFFCGGREKAVAFSSRSVVKYWKKILGGGLMKRIFCTMVMLLMLICQTAFAADFGKLVILHTNDTHGFDKYGNFKMEDAVAWQQGGAE